jgi:predicted esterase
MVRSIRSKRHVAANQADHYRRIGLGDSGDGWSSLAHDMGRALPHVKWIFPHAYVTACVLLRRRGHRLTGGTRHSPRRPITVNGGLAMPGWYDITALDREASHDSAGLAASAQYGTCPCLSHVGRTH